MRAILEQAQLLKSLQAVERAINERSSLPILSNVLLETTQHELIVTATDLDVGVQYRIPLRVGAEEGAVTLPAKRFTTIIRELPLEEVTLEAKKNHTASVVCGNTHFRVQGLPSEDFPIFPTPEHEQPITMPQALLKTLLTHTAFAMSMEETRFILNGALLAYQDGALTMVATDGRRLALAKIPVSGHAPAFRVVLPSKTVRELTRLLTEDDEVLIAPLKDQQLLFRFGGVTLLTRLIEGQFPAYEQVIPAPTHTTLTCARQLLHDAIRRVSVMTTATSQAIVFEITADQIVVSKESPELGSAREEVPATYTGAAMTVAFNPEFWLDALRTLEADEVVVELTTPEKPAVIRLPDALQLILPMKLA
jgi:DNA polymerase-3 subunit beta